jgi:signal transduction histidine kinase
MPEIKRDTNERSIFNFENYSLAEITYHIIGNELAVISGYTQLLLREAAAQEKEPSLLDVERVAQRHEKQVSYLRIMKQSEEALNTFLAQLRGCSLAMIKRSFNEQPVRTPFVPLCKQIIEKFAPLYKDRPLQTQLPVQPLYVLCNRVWTTRALEHIVNDAIADHTASTPVLIEVEGYTDPSNDLHTARIAIHITRGPVEHEPETEEIFDMWLHTSDERDRDVCMALCSGVLHGHGGRLWIEREAEQREIVYATLPLVK